MNITVIMIIIQCTIYMKNPFFNTHMTTAVEQSAKGFGLHVKGLVFKSLPRET